MKKDASAPTRIAAYMRVSTDEQRDAGTIENQRLEIARFAEYKKYEILDYFEDGGVSGVKSFHERPQGSQLWAAVAAGEYDAVIVYKIDRLARRIKHVLDFTDLAEQSKCRIITCNENIDFSSQWGKLILSILAAFAEAEHAAITERAISGKRRKLSNGLVLGKPPYGYINNNGKLEIDEARAPFVREIFERYVKGESYRKIRDYLRDQSAPLPPKKGAGEGKWAHHHISNILHIHAYYGEYQGFKSKPRKDDKYDGQRDIDDIIKIQVTPLISKQLFDQAQAKITENRFLGPQSKKRFYLLRGMLRCGRCGMLYSGLGYKGVEYKIRTGIHKGEIKTYDEKFYYECSSKYKTYVTDRPACGNINLNASEIEALIWGKAEEVLLKPSVYTQKIIEIQRNSSNSVNSLYKQLARIETAIGKEDSKRNRVVRAIAGGTITRDEAMPVIEEFRRELEVLNEQKAKIDLQINETDESKQNRLDTVKSVLDAFATKFKQGISNEDKRQIIELLFAKIEVFTEYLDGNGVDPDDPRGFKRDKQPRVEATLIYDEDSFIGAVSPASRPIQEIKS